MNLLKSVNECLELLPPAPIIALHSACAEPQSLLEGLVGVLRSGVTPLSGATLYALTYRGAGSPPPLYADTVLLGEGKLHLKSFFPHPSLRHAAHAGLVDYVPASFSTVPGLIRRGYLKLDAAFLQVSVPDAEGYCSLGPSADYAEALVDSVPLLIAEMNHQMPRINGLRVHIDRFAAVIESDRPLLEVPPLEAGDLERRVAVNVASLIGDGATVQLGVGTVPEQVARLLKSHRNLGIHGGAITDPLIELLESGAVTNQNKPFDKGKSVTALLIGTQRLFDYAHEHPAIELQGIDVANNPAHIAQLPNFVSVNSAIEVDYWGQVNAEAVGDWQLAGVGGQLDYVIGAWGAENGLSIIALPSVTAKGHPRIVPHLKASTPVSTPRHLAQIIVTENGIADLRGKSLSERKNLLMQLIS
ncbi:acetyl-CoA hydrolase/transferase C-terminal domain-containing protein [Candidatus Chlorohelix sp.]|uniref:acetyl-CoA hydrolase/transferase family protein n=1 Tax=Candidatus Chlorohelix sp. TaxID=3139201 RepID=UPI00302261E5